MKVMCEMCGRQIVDYCIKPDDRITKPPYIRLIGNQYCCGECGEDLDENGLFPEERE